MHEDNRTATSPLGHDRVKQSRTASASSQRLRTRTSTAGRENAHWPAATSARAKGKYRAVAHRDGEIYMHARAEQGQVRTKGNSSGRLGVSLLLTPATKRIPPLAGVRENPLVGGTSNND